jgi:hypothetical protein
MAVWRAGSRACCLVENWVWRRVDVTVVHSVEWRVVMRAVSWVDGWVERRGVTRAHMWGVTWVFCRLKVFW